MSSNTEQALGETLAEFRLDGLVDVKNPLDVTPMANDAAFARILARILADDPVDMVVAGIVPLTPAMQTLAPGPDHGESIHSADSIVQLLPGIAAGTDTPLVAVVDSGAWFDPMADELMAGGVPVFRSADRAVRVVCKWIDVKRRIQDPGARI